MDSYAKTRLMAAWGLALTLTAAWGTSLMALADKFPNGLPRAVIWNGGFFSAILLGPLVIHALYGRKASGVTPMYIASLLFYVVVAFALLVRIAFYLAWRRGNVEL